MQEHTQHQMSPQGSGNNPLLGVSEINSPIKDLHYEQDRWATTRGLNVEEISSLWREDPNRVRVISDPKLGSNQLVLLSKSVLERIVGLLTGLENGYVGMRHDLDMLEKHLSLVSNIIKDQDGNAIKSVEIAVSLMTSTVVQSKLQFVSAIPRETSIAPPELTAEEWSAVDYE
jgi:hypothetical protein